MSEQGEPLLWLLRHRIAVEGAIPVSQFMAEVLLHPREGYYMRADPFGADGDFVTAPEISQMFGEVLGLWCADAWIRMGSPSGVILAELGPGRGTLMHDALRAIGKVAPDFRRALSVHLVEVSPVLRAKQAQVLAGENPTWHAETADLPSGPLLLIANEFFDALPIRQFRRTPAGWCERLIEAEMASDRLRFVLDLPLPAMPGLLQPAFERLSYGATVEVCPAGKVIAEDLGQRLARDGGAALFIDYSYDSRRPGFPGGDTLQAVRRHTPVAVLDHPGQADITAHVDFGALAIAGEAGGAKALGPVEQGPFLLSLGMTQRAEILKHGATPEQAAEIDSGLHRLTDRTQMGSLFQVMALVDSRLNGLAGF
ncbi:NADH dehydrogenase (ubiquinone) 1 alpha subcomplex assembly factor 7 [uncultured Gammaproteobacteria bacterium]